MSTLILPLSKNADPRGRIGSRELQDWLLLCKKAALLQSSYRSVGRDSRILILSAFRAIGSTVSEADYYERALACYGVEKSEIQEAQCTYETIGELEYALHLAEKEHARLVIIVTFLHFPRVWWLTCGKNKVDCQIVFGIPRPEEAFTDMVGMILFPIIDLLGFRKTWQRYIRDRRIQGIHL